MWSMYLTLPRMHDVVNVLDIIPMMQATLLACIAFIRNWCLQNSDKFCNLIGPLGNDPLEI